MRHIAAAPGHQSLGTAGAATAMMGAEHAKPAPNGIELNRMLDEGSSEGTAPLTEPEVKEESSESLDELEAPAVGAEGPQPSSNWGSVRPKEKPWSVTAYDERNSFLACCLYILAWLLRNTRHLSTPSPSCVLCTLWTYGRGCSPPAFSRMAIQHPGDRMPSLGHMRLEWSVRMGVIYLITIAYGLNKDVINSKAFSVVPLNANFYATFALGANVGISVRAWAEHQGWRVRAYTVYRGQRVGSHHPRDIRRCLMDAAARARARTHPSPVLIAISPLYAPPRTHSSHAPLSGARVH